VTAPECYVNTYIACIVIVEDELVYCAERTEFLNINRVNVSIEMAEFVILAYFFLGMKIVKPESRLTFWHQSFTFKF
jgi:hypothetical protein